jgi:SAM-dependent methyltransferase
MRRVVEIGAQQLSNSFLRSDEMLRELFGGKPPQLGQARDAGFAGGLELQPDDAPPARPFWEALGFDYAAIDFDGHRDSRAVDLNRDAVPREWKGRFDLAVNAGTTEHVVNHGTAFQVMHDLVRPGGIMIHEVPAAGMLTHGMVNYTMKFFWHLCRENNYEVMCLEMAPGGAAPLPDNIVATNRRWGRNRSAPRLEAEPIRDWYIFASLRKPKDVPFVTPLDLPPEVMPKR